MCAISAFCQHSPIHHVHESGSIQHRRLHQEVHHGCTSRLPHTGVKSNFFLGDDVHVIQRRTDCSATLLLVQGVPGLSHWLPRLLQLSGANDSSSSVYDVSQIPILDF